MLEDNMSKLTLFLSILYKEIFSSLENYKKESFGAKAKVLYRTFNLFLFLLFLSGLLQLTTFYIPFSFYSTLLLLAFYRFL